MFIVLGCALFFCPFHASFARGWATTDGVQFTGELVRYTNGTVIIQSDEAGKVLYAIDKLSASDQAYVRKRFPQGDKQSDTVKPDKQPNPVETQRQERASAPSGQSQHRIGGQQIQSQINKSESQETAIGDTPFRAYAFKKGDKALPLSGQIQGSPDRVELEDLRGKLVLVHAWSHNNKYTRNHLPFLAMVYEKYRRKGFEIIGVHVPGRGSSGSWRAINQVERQLGVTWLMNNDAQARITKRWGFRHIPTYTLIDGNGLILYPGIALSDLETAIRDYMRLDE